jgi:arsenate reductase-like glutaredoxin family protein
MIENQPNELTLIYHSDKEDDKKARAFIETVVDYKVKTLDLKKESLTETQLAELAGKMGLPVQELVDKTYTDQLESNNKKITGTMWSNDVLTLLKQEPILIQTPIVIIGKKAYTYASSYDLLTETRPNEGVRASSGNVEEIKDK